MRNSSSEVFSASSSFIEVARIPPNCGLGGRSNCSRRGVFLPMCGHALLYDFCRSAGSMLCDRLGFFIVQLIVVDEKCLNVVQRMRPQLCKCLHALMGAGVACDGDQAIILLPALA